MTLEEQIKFEKIVAAEAAKVGRQKYPSPYWDRMYEFPRGYQQPEVLKKRLGEWLGTTELLHNVFPQSEPDAASITYHGVALALYAQQFPLYLLTRPLVEMLALTDWPPDSSLDFDAAPPYPACTFVVPMNMLGDSDSAKMWSVSYALLADPEKKKRILVVACCMDGTFGYYGRYAVSPEGRVMFEAEGTRVFEMCEAHEIQVNKKAEIVMPAGPDFLEGVVKFVLTLFIYLNIDKKKSGGTTPEELIKTIKGKGPGMPRREQKRPAMIGVNLKPSGFATHGTHSSPCTHLRRGHMRWVRFGKGFTDKERRWIPATIVNQRIDHKDEPTNTTS